MLAPFRGLDPSSSTVGKLWKVRPKKVPFKVSLRPNEAMQRVTEWARS
jgi:hypothetical protein